MTGHSHSHGHSHASVGSWAQWLSDRTLRIVLGGVLLAGVLTLVGVVALWPSSDDVNDTAANAADFGLRSQRVEATTERLLEQPCSYSTPESPEQCLILSFRVKTGPDAGQPIVLPTEVNLANDLNAPNLSVGDDVILGYEVLNEGRDAVTGEYIDLPEDEEDRFYFYADRDRRGSLAILAGLFALFVIALGRFRGVLALAAMALTVVVLVWFVAPSVLDGNDPLMVAVVAAAAIAFVSLYLTHGFSPTTTVALAGTLGALGLTLGLSWLFFQLMNFTGTATEEALILPLISGDLDVTSLLLGGAVIGALGALDDVTVTQVATVAELRFRSPDLPTRELITSGIRVGREHIASTVNTLLLAYAGASLPLILLFAASDQSLDIVANSELIAVEVVRTLCGSIGLVAAVPITTMLAALVTSGGRQDELAGPDEPADDSAEVPPIVPDVEQDDEPAAETLLDSDQSREPEPESRPVPEPEPPPEWDDFAPRDGLDLG